jgi:carbamoyl-phosphate synthase large subunit
MSAETTVLVTGVGACGVGEGVAKALRMAGRYDIIAVNADANAPELFEVDKRYLVPRATEPGYMDAISEICRRHEVRVILPGSEPEALVLSRSRSQFAEAGIAVLTNPPEVVATCQDKWRTYEFLSGAGLSTPATFRPLYQPEFSEHLDFPMILKPRAGHASQNVFIVHTREELDSYLQHFAAIEVEPIAQEYVAGDEEYTCSALMGSDGQVLGSIAMRRTLMGGFSQRVVVDEFPEAIALTERVAGALGAWGPVNVQCRYAEGAYWVFEINARFSGSAPFRALVGFNEPDVLIRHVLGEDQEPASIQRGVVGMRRLEEVIVPATLYEAVESIG